MSNVFVHPWLQRTKNVITLIAAFVLAIQLGGCQPKQQKTLHDTLRPLQSGSLIDVAPDPTSTDPSESCSYGFHAVDHNMYGLVTAVHCTNVEFNTDGEFLYMGERIWQAYGINSSSNRPIAQVALKPNVLTYSNSTSCREAIDSLGSAGQYIYACLPADAAFAPFAEQNIRDNADEYIAGGVASLPLSTNETKIGPVDEKHPDKYTGYISSPISGKPIYKIGATTGKTEGELAIENPILFVAERFGQMGEILYLGVYVVRNINSAPLVDFGDSGGAAFHPTYTGGPNGDFNLIGLTIGQATDEQGNSYLIIEPLDDILGVFPSMEVEHAGQGGGLGLPDGS